MSSLPPLAVSMGDPAGIGPEIIVKAWELRAEKNLNPFFYLGCPKALEALPNCPPFEIISSPIEANKVFQKALPVINMPTEAPIQLGKLNKLNGNAVVKAIETGVQLTLKGECRALITSPIHKEALYDIGFKHAGHTGLLAELTKTSKANTIMMLASPELKVALVTVHLPLKDVPQALTVNKIIATTKITSQALKQNFKIQSPKIAMAGLNPHAGEGGSIGLEEREIITPAIKALAEKGITVNGPIPPDTLFTKPMRESYDAAICMYHDQALIPLKTLDFDNGVNVTLGIPIIRTSPDHGTALNIAGKNKANPSSLIAAIKLADEMSQNDE